MKIFYASLLVSGLLLVVACSSSSTPTPEPTSMPVETRPAAKSTSTPKMIPTHPPLPTVTPPPTATAEPAPTATAEPDPTATAEPAPTSTPRPTPTVAPLPTATTEPTPTPTETPTVTPTPMPTATPTPIATPFGQFPLLFNQFSGTVTLGGQPAPNGEFISAHVKWWVSRPSKIFNGSYTALLVVPNDWALQGQTITFHLGELQAEETAIYNGQAFIVENLSLTFP